MEKPEKGNPNQRLKRARQQHGWSQEALAERIGAHEKNVSKWERGISSPGPYFQEKLCELFEMSAVELGFFKEEANGGSEHVSSQPPDAQDATVENNSALPSQALTDTHEGVSESTQKKPLLLNMPFQRNPFFTAHEDMLKQLHDVFVEDESRVSLLPQAITGLGGIGKTQIAIEYVFRYQNDYQTILWVNADSRETLTQNCTRIIDALHITGDRPSPQKNAIDAFKSWLNHQAQWLLVVDNVEDMGVLNEFLPALRNGHVLLTTRTQITGGLAHNVELEKMDEGEGALLLLRRAKKIRVDDLLDKAQPSDGETAKMIAQEMDGLPLAIDQAGAYIEETGCSLPHYLELYRANHARLLRRRGSPDFGYPESVAATWVISFTKVRQMNRASIELLQFLAFLSPDAIPESLIRHSAPHLTLRLRFAALDPFKLDAAIGVLRRFSLVQRNAEQEALSIHRLVQTVMRDKLSKRVQRRWAKRTVKAVNRAFSLGVYIPQAQGCATFIEQWGLVSKEAANLLYQAGDHAQQRALYRLAKPLLLQSLEMSGQVFGPQSINVMNCLISLSIVHVEQRQFELAERCRLRALEISQRVPGLAQSPEVTSYLLDLARRYAYQERNEEAEVCYQQALNTCERSSEKDPSQLFATLSRFAAFYRNQGKLTEAESLYQRVRSISQNAFGEESLEVALNAKDLADAYLAQEKYAQAEELLEQALAICDDEQEDMVTAECLGSLADAYTFQKKYELAEPLYQRAMTIVERVGRPESGEMVKMLLGYSVLLQELGRVEEAILFLERANTMIEQIASPTILDRFLAYQRGLDKPL